MVPYNVTARPASGLAPPTVLPALSAGPSLLLGLGRLLHANLSLNVVLGAIIEQAPSLVACRHAAIWLQEDNDLGRMRCIASVGDPVGIDDADETIRHLVGLPLIASSGERCGFLYVRRDAPFTAAESDILAALSGFAALAVENTRLRERHERSAARQRLLDQIGEYLHQTLDLDELIARIFEEVNKAIHAEAQSIWLVDAEADGISCRFATGPGAEQVKQVTVPYGEGLVGNTVARREAILVGDAQQDVRHSRRAQQKTGMVTHSLMSVPLVRSGRAIGAIQAINKQCEIVDPLEESPEEDIPRFNSDDLELLRGIADIAALCIENTRLYAELEASYDTTLDALTAALDLRDRETEGHSRRVVEFTARLAEQLGLSKSEIRSIRRGALLHDIGKIGVPDAILHKPGPLTLEERRIIEQHPETGYAMLLGIPYLKDEVRLVLTHQERWDGQGYPFGLQGDQVPLESRLFMIADTFDAITSNRPYRKARAYEEAAAIIAQEAGRQFDPALVETFLSVPPDEWDAIHTRVMEEIAKRQAESPVPSGYRHLAAAEPTAEDFDRGIV